ncbi:MAG: hypothetical protein AAB731_00185 [Patescibacteria group bacterium]
MSKPAKKDLAKMTDKELRAFVRGLIKKEDLPPSELTEEEMWRILRKIFSARLSNPKAGK